MICAHFDYISGSAGDHRRWWMRFFILPIRRFAVKYLLRKYEMSAGADVDNFFPKKVLGCRGLFLKKPPRSFCPQKNRGAIFESLPPRGRCRAEARRKEWAVAKATANNGFEQNLIRCFLRLSICARAFFLPLTPSVIS